MNTLLQNSIVAILVFAAALYATWLLLPSRSRLRLVNWLLRMIPESSNGPGLLRRVLLRRAGKPLKGCDHCQSGSDIHPKR